MALKLNRLDPGSSDALPDKSLDSRKHDDHAKKESMGAHADATTAGGINDKYAFRRWLKSPTFEDWEHIVRAIRAVMKSPE